MFSRRTRGLRWTRNTFALRTRVLLVYRNTWSVLTLDTRTMLNIPRRYTGTRGTRISSLLFNHRLRLRITVHTKRRTHGKICLTRTIPLLFPRGCWSWAPLRKVLDRATELRLRTALKNPIVRYVTRGRSARRPFPLDTLPLLNWRTVRT